MQNVLADAISPYLRGHADNPVAWQQWGDAAFSEAASRDVPVLVSIGYATCHWCHVMARESFSDPELAEYLNEHFVAIKVDREEHPDVDAGYLAAASAFTENLGWPLNVFVTPAGRAFFAGTYWPPQPMVGHPSFRQVLEGVAEAWELRRDEVESNAAAVTDAIGAQANRRPGTLPSAPELGGVVEQLAAYEDTELGGFGPAPKFPVTPVLRFLLEHGSAVSIGLAQRTLDAMAASDLRDPIEGGFFRYATRRDWSEPHYERMLYDNAQLLHAYSLLALRSPDAAATAADVSRGIADYLLRVLRLPGGAFASAQDSESTVDGQRVEGGYYRLDEAARRTQQPPALDEKVLTGWNGLAIGALAFSGFHQDHPEWIQAARDAADALLATHLRPNGELVRASADGRVSSARATLEDYGMFADGLLQLALSTGEVAYAITARDLIDRCLGENAFLVPGGADPVLAGQGMALSVDASEGAYPSGASAMAAAANRLYLLTADRRYREAGEQAMRGLAPLAMRQPMGFGGALTVMANLVAQAGQLVVVGDDTAASGLVELARRWFQPGSVAVAVTSEQATEWSDAGFELLEGRVASGGLTTAYLCRDFVCRLPVTEPDELRGLLTAPTQP